MRHLALFAGILVCFGAGLSRAEESVWLKSYNPTDETRFIPVELWTGGDWFGDRDLKMTPADLVFGDEQHKSIVGPKAWVHPQTGKALQVYERRNREKLQLFSVRSDGAGLGRVFDNRRDRACIDGIKFPLGLWRNGETRRFTFKCWRDGKRFERTVEITIEEIDFVYDGTPHAMRYVWVVDSGDRKGMNNAYTYAPGLGNVALEYRH